jgi:transposase-like protein
VEACLDSNVQCIDIRIGSDDEGGLTKAINNVFPNAARLLCSKHIKNNVTDDKE